MLPGVSRQSAFTLGAILVASLCCGGSLVLASLGLGAFYGSLGLSRWAPQLLGAGALSIALVNYILFVRAATPLATHGVGDVAGMRRRMIVGAAVGIAAMGFVFVVLEWVNHAVVHPEAFLALPDYGGALISGVPNARLVYALETFAALPLLWALPFPDRERRALGSARTWVLAGAAVVLTLLLLSGVTPIDAAGPVAPAGPHRSVPHGGG